jgi:rubrerythrin
LLRIASVDILEILDRCGGLERGAGDVYTMLAERFADDPGLHTLWQRMAEEEREHARKLETWRALVAAELPEHRPVANGFADAIHEMEILLRNARSQAWRCASADEAFALALGLEESELDSLYTTLLRSSAITRSSDAATTIREETAAHHEALVRMVRERSRDEANLLRASLLAKSEPDGAP